MLPDEGQIGWLINLLSIFLSSIYLESRCTIHLWATVTFVDIVITGIDNDYRLYIEHM